MGEIADAVRRARLERAPLSPPAAAPPPEAVRRRPGVSEPAAVPETVQPLAPADAAIVRSATPELEACRQLALHIRMALEQRGVRSVAVVSALRNEGKTTVSCNLAIALASLSPTRSVALVELDLRNPSVASVLGIRPRAGVERFLEGRGSLEEARVALEQPPFDVYPALLPQHAAHELLTRGRLGELISGLERAYETVLVDTPPTLLVPDARLVLREVAACIPVARAGTTRVRAFRELIEALPEDRILGSLLNGRRGHGSYYYGYTYSSSSEAAEPEPTAEGDADARRPRLEAGGGLPRRRSGSS